MSEHRVTVAQLISRLQAYPADMLVAVIYPGHGLEDGARGRSEGQLDGPAAFEVTRVGFARSGYNYPLEQWQADDEHMCTDVLILSDVGRQWLENS